MYSSTKDKQNANMMKTRKHVDIVSTATYVHAVLFPRSHAKKKQKKIYDHGLYAHACMYSNINFNTILLLKIWHENNNIACQ